MTEKQLLSKLKANGHLFDSIPEMNTEIDCWICERFEITMDDLDEWLNIEKLQQLRVETALLGV